MEYQERCGDCGGEIGERKVSTRHDICDACWRNREWLLSNRELIGMAEFQKIQRSMASHRGTAKKRIEKLKRVKVEGQRITYAKEGKSMKIRWQWLLYPVTVPLYLTFLLLVYLPIVSYTVFRAKRARDNFIKAVKAANEGKIPEGLVIPGPTGSVKGKSV